MLRLEPTSTLLLVEVRFAAVALCFVVHYEASTALFKVEWRGIFYSPSHI